MTEKCAKCCDFNKPGKNYPFYYGEILSSYSYDTTRYSGSKMITTTHSNTRYRMHGQEDVFICHKCIIKSEEMSNLIWFGVIIAMALLLGFGLQFVFYSRATFIGAMLISAGLFVFAIINLTRGLAVANSDDPEKQEEYLTKNELFNSGCRMAIKLRKRHLSMLSDKKLVYFTPTEYYRLKTN